MLSAARSGFLGSGRASVAALARKYTTLIAPSLSSQVVLHDFQLNFLIYLFFL